MKTPAKFKEYIWLVNTIRKDNSRGDRYLSHSSHHTQVPVPVTNIRFVEGGVNLRCRHRGRLLAFFVLICLVNSFHSCNWGAGSYPYSEVYMIDLSSSDELIDKINEMKLRSPQLNIHYKNENEDTVTLDEMIPNYYICRFLIDNMVYMCAINLNQQKQKTVSLRFVSICEIEEIGRGAQHWKRINTDDLTKKGNEAFKIKFEKRILNNLGVRWRRMST